MAKPQKDDLKVSLLDFDPQNPRFLADFHGPEKTVIHRLLEQEDILELILSIGRNGYFEGEPLLVTPNGNRYYVVEGNRRLAALKLLHEPTLAPKSRSVQAAVSDAKPENIPVKVPCLIFQSRKDTLEYLGFRHISGAKPWGPLAKARFLKQIQNELPEGLTFEEQSRELAKSIGSNPPTVKSLLISYGLFKIIEKKSFYEIEGLSAETLEFGVFYTAIKAADIFEYIGEPSSDKNLSKHVKLEKLENLVRWLFERRPDPISGQLTTRVGESRNIVKLCRVIRNPTIIKRFEKNPELSLAGASEMAGEAIENFVNNTRLALDKIKQSAALVGSIREQLGQDHMRVTSELEYDAQELAQKVRKQVSINGKV